MYKPFTLIPLKTAKKTITHPINKHTISCQTISPDSSMPELFRRTTLLEKKKFDLNLNLIINSAYNKMFLRPIVLRWKVWVPITGLISYVIKFSRYKFIFYIYRI